MLLFPQSPNSQRSDQHLFKYFQICVRFLIMKFEKVLITQLADALLPDIIEVSFAN